MDLGHQASLLGPGHGMLDAAIGAQSDLGLFVRMEVMHRFTPQLYGGINGRGTYDLAGPRRGKLSGQVLGLLGARW